MLRCHSRRPRGRNKLCALRKLIVASQQFTAPTETENDASNDRPRCVLDNVSLDPFRLFTGFSFVPRKPTMLRFCTKYVEIKFTELHTREKSLSLQFVSDLCLADMKDRGRAAFPSRKVVVRWTFKNLPRRLREIAFRIPKSFRPHAYLDLSASSWLPISQWRKFTFLGRAKPRLFLTPCPCVSDTPLLSDILS
jgi:hypothetical protein